MSRTRRVLLGIAVLLLLIAGGVAVFVLTFKPAQREAVAEAVEPTPELLSRGRYLVAHVTACADCHSARDWTRYGGPIEGEPFAGGGCWGPDAGMPGSVCLPNITPHRDAGIGGWTDGEIMRAVREGVDRTGAALFPSMPYANYRRLSDDDARAIVVYLRSLEPSDNQNAKSEVTFPTSFFIKMAPAPLEGPVSAPSPSDTKAYGEYLATIAGCVFCHTPVDDRHQPIPGKLLAGGHEFVGPFGKLRAVNLTPHETGLTKSREELISFFRAFADPGSQTKVPPESNTVMPWLAYAGMTDEDLGAIYEYLVSVPPVENRVERR